MQTNKKNWIKPTISEHAGNTLNKFGRTPVKEYTDELEGISIDTLIKEYGSPLFVLSEKKLRENVRKLRETFESRYQPVVMVGLIKQIT